MSSVVEAAETEQLEAELAEWLQRLEEAPGDPEVNREVGYRLGGLARFAEAASHFRKATAGAPEDREAWRGLGLALSRAGDPAGAREALEKAFSSGVDDAVARAELALVLGRLGDPRAALAQSERALSLAAEPRIKARLHVLVGCYHRDLGDRKAELKEYHHAIELCPEDEDVQHVVRELLRQVGKDPDEVSPAKAAAWYALGLAARNAGELETARGALERAISSGLEESRCYGELAWVLMWLKEYRAAIDYANRALEFPLNSERHAWVHTVLGYCYSELGDGDTAMSHWLEAARQAPEDAEALRNLGTGYSERDDFVTAVTFLKKAVSLDPEDWKAWYALGFSANRTGEYDLAREALERVLLITREDEGRTRKELAYSCQRLGDFDAAIPQALRALPLAEEADLRAAVHAMLAYSYQELGDRSSALKHGEEAVQADPSNAEAWYNLACSYLEDGRPRDALAGFEKAAALRPEDAESLLWIARCCVELEDFHRAETILRRLLEAGYDDRAHLFLVESVYGRGRKEKALRLAREGVATRPDSAWAWGALGHTLREEGELEGATEAFKKAEELDPDGGWRLDER